MLVLFEKYCQKKIGKEGKNIAKSRCGRRADNETRRSDNNPAEHGEEADRCHMGMSLMEMRTPEGDSRMSAVGVGGWREVELTIKSPMGGAQMPSDDGRTPPPAHHA